MWPFSLHLLIPIQHKHTYKANFLASEMYLKELVALSLSFPRFGENILTVNSQLSTSWRKFELQFLGSLIEANRFEKQIIEICIFN